MLRLRDQRSGDLVLVSPARRGELSIYVALPPDTGPDLSGLRGFVIADVLGRVAERRGLRVSAWHSVPDDAHEVWRGALRALNIYPAQYAAEPPNRLDIGIAAAGPGPAAAPGSRWLRPGDVLGAEAGIGAVGDVLGAEAGIGAAGDGAAATGIGAAGDGAVGRDPLTLRLALLRSHYREPVRLGRGEMSAAAEELRGWREQVARWATFPSKPMCAGYLDHIAEAFDEDLDTPGALAALRSLARDEEIPPGSKFETFAYLDRLLGLDLARDVGR